MYTQNEQFFLIEPLVIIGDLDACALGNSLIDLEHCYLTFVQEMNCLYNKSFETSVFKM